MINDNNMLNWWPGFDKVLPQFCKNLKTTLIRHSDIEKRHIRLEGSEQFQGFCAVAGLGRFVTLIFWNTGFDTHLCDN